MRTVRRAVVALALAAAVPAAAYILPVGSILRKLGERRAALSLDALDVQGTLTVRGPASEQIAVAAGLRPSGAEVSVPARFLMKIPGRCRLELAMRDVPEAQRPHVALRDARDARPSGPLAEIPAAAAFVRGACALLAASPLGDPAEAYAAAMSRRGVALNEASLGRFDGRIAYVVGGRQRDAKPLLFVEKGGFQPLRLVYAEGKDLLDVRLVGWGAATGGDWFPRAVEVFAKDAAVLRFDTEKASANAKLPEALFP